MPKMVPETRRRIPPTILALLSLHAAASSLQAQVSRIPAATVACRSCTLILEEQHALGLRPDDQVAPTRWIVVDAKGRFFATDDMRPNEVHVFDSLGNSLTVFGRDGDGPGEYRYIQWLTVGLADSLHVFDSRRETVLDPQTFQVGRMAPLAARPMAAIVLSDGTKVINAQVASVERRGYPIHVVRGTAISRSFGTDDPANTERREFFVLRSLAPGEAGDFWTAPLDRYQLERWDTTGTRVAFLQPDNGFPPWARYTGITRDSRPQTQLVGLRRRESHLWVLLHVPAENWRGALVESRRPDGTVAYAERTRGAAYDTRLDVWDIATNQLIASAVVPQFFLTFVGTERLGEAVELESGHQYMRIWRVHLQREP